MFKEPSLEQEKYDEELGKGVRPLLFLLRRDLKDFQYDDEDATPMEDGMNSPLLTCLGIMIGFELLTKFWTGQVEVNRDWQKKFLDKYTCLNSEKSGFLVRFRNAVAHSYSLTDVTKDGKKIRFELDADIYKDNEAVSLDDSGDEKKVYINAWGLNKLFLDSIKKYKKELDDDLGLQCKFYVVQRELRNIQIRKSSKSTD